MSVTGLLLTGGHGPGRSDLEPFLGEVGPIVAADSGFDLALALGLRPELIVGDMDSVRARLPQERVRRFPRDKEFTDTELGLQALKDLGCDRVVIAGGGGGRLDHLLFIVALFERETVPLCWITAHEHVEAIRGTAAYRGWVGQTVVLSPAVGGGGDRALGRTALAAGRAALETGRGRRQQRHHRLTHAVDNGSGRPVDDPVVRPSRGRCSARKTVEHRQPRCRADRGHGPGGCD